MLAAWRQSAADSGRDGVVAGDGEEVSGSGESGRVEEDGPAPEEEQLGRLVGISRTGPRRVETPVEDSLSPWADQIYQWLTGDRMQLTRIQELLAARGCTVSYTSLRRFIVKRNWGQRSVYTVWMADTPPGELAEADFGRLGIDHRPGDGPAPRGVGADHRAVLLTPLFRLGYLHSEAGGRDRRPGGSVGVLRWRAQESGHRQFPGRGVGPDPLHPRLTRGLLEHSQHPDFVADPTLTRHARDKPNVERSMSSVGERLFKGGDFHNLTHLRAQAQR